MAAAAALTGKLTDVRKVADWKSPAPTKATHQYSVVSDDKEDSESIDDVELLDDLPEDGQQSGTKNTKTLSDGTGVVPFTQLRGIGKLKF